MDYKAFWEQGVPVGVIDMEKALSKYKIVVAPMLYLVKLLKRKAK